MLYASSRSDRLKDKLFVIALFFGLFAPGAHGESTHGSKGAATQSASPQTVVVGEPESEVYELIKADFGRLMVIYQPDASSHYSAYSKRIGEQGDVVLRLIVSESGNVEEVVLLRSSGYPRLDRAATVIGRRYRFKPLLIDGKPVKVSTNVLIKFNLKTDEEGNVKPKFETNSITIGWINGGW
jgi:TonB family protein